MIFAPLRRSLLVAGMATLLLTSTALAAGDHFNTKFEFSPVTIGDSMNLTIYAASKHNKSDVTVCEYQTAEGDFLGYFESLEFASEDAATIEQFCIASFDARETPKA